MDKKGRSKGAGWALGFFLGIIGVIIAASLSDLSPPKTDEPRKSTQSKPVPQKTCPQCGVSNPESARHCMDCGATFYDDEQAVHQAAVKALKPFDELLTVEAFVQAISGQDEVVRQKAAEILGEQDDEHVLGPLFRLLNDEAEKVRAAAAKSLGQLGYAQAVEPLLEALNDQAVTVRRAAAEALQQWSDPQMVAPLIQALTDEDATVRLKAAEQLGRLEDDRVLEPLFDVLGDEEADVRGAAVNSLVQISDDELPSLTQALYLMNGDVEERLQAAVTLGELSDARVMGFLQRAMESEKESRVRAAIAQSLQSLGADPAPILIQQLERQSRSDAADLLVEMGEDAVDPLLQALESTSYVPGQRRITEVLSRIGDTRAVPALVEFLESDAGPTTEAAKALGVLGDQRATLPLVKTLKKAYFAQRRAAVQALIQLNDEQAIDPLVELLEDNKREYAIQVLQGMGEAGMQALIQTYEETEDRETRKAIGEALGDKKPKRGLFG